MEYRQLLKERFSVRKFTAEPVEEDKVSAILEAARLAPTAANKQSQRILVIRTAEGMEKLKACTSYTFNAPMALVVCCNVNEAWVREFDNCNSGIVDATVVATHVMLAIHDMGFGATCVTYFKPDILRETFNFPANIEPVAIFPMGHPAPNAKPSPQHEQRRPLSEIVIYDTF